PRGVAQLGSALRSGRRGRGFKSRHPDQVRRPVQKNRPSWCLRGGCSSGEDTAPPSPAGVAVSGEPPPLLRPRGAAALPTPQAQEGLSAAGFPDGGAYEKPTVPQQPERRSRLPWLAAEADENHHHNTDI